ncbi:DUF6653 family protein [Notoacmeibacter sp. MSK16QG-6]|uniref:DUF6653 family protein n=1 Tax=Notoacmeibacter sp. MSK16QG-6 TaxID=2957982 RepID=UPI00209D0917|nr:DUF6653 family protein [Notoacmeibacter sp. MSK16QG-6]MCP1198428.1 hypothetical protein [Notoacmeibacter sp. MSK16QG-6]
MRSVSEVVMGMDDEIWRRHASPWSVYTRVPTILLFTLAIWSRFWIGWWAIVPISIVAIWTFLNPRLFAPPTHFDGWAQRVVLGEQIWIERKKRSIPFHHRRAATLLLIATALCCLPLIYGLVWRNPWAAFGGATLLSTFKLWFCDRMAWLQRDMAQRGEANASDV